MRNKGRMPALNRAQVIFTLTAIRKEWEEACNGYSPMEIKGSVGLLLNDVVNAVGLEPDEKAAILGASIMQEIDLVC